MSDFIGVETTLSTIVLGGICFLLYHSTKGKTIETPPEMRDPTKLRDDIITFYFQGNNSSRGQAAIYAGPEGVQCFTGDDESKVVHHFSCPIAPRILHNIYMYKELDDLSYNASYYNPLTFLLKFFSYCKNCQERITGPSHVTHLTRWSVGGLDDVDQFLENIMKMIDEHPNKKVVVFGPSRGGSTVLIGVSQLPKEYQDRISLVIVEAPFTSFPDVLRSWPYLRYLSSVQLYLLSTFGRYKHDQITPIQVIKNIPKSIPMAFVISRVDTTVNPKLSKELWFERTLCGTNIHLCKLNNSHHIGMPTSNLADQKKYYSFVEKLYERYLS